MEASRYLVREGKLFKIASSSTDGFNEGGGSEGAVSSSNGSGGNGNTIGMRLYYFALFNDALAYGKEIFSGAQRYQFHRLVRVFGVVDVLGSSTDFLVQSDKGKDLRLRAKDRGEKQIWMNDMLDHAAPLEDHAAVPISQLRPGNSSAGRRNSEEGAASSSSARQRHRRGRMPNAAAADFGIAPERRNSNFV